jgi:O-antigen/teichoic acid export membrane protein
MKESIEIKAKSAVVWNTFEKFFIRIGGFVVSIILARLLSPSDYGLIGMLSVFISLSSIFIESGFAKALIYKENCTDIDYSTIFYTNLIISIVISLLLCIISPFVADFYNEPILSDLLRVLSLNLVLGSFNIVQRAKIMKDIDFRSLAFINFIGMIIGGVIGIVMAYMGFGVWALIGQTLASTLALVLVFPFFSRWTPSFVFSTHTFTELFGYGSKLLVAQVSARIINSISTVAVGKIYQSSQLGYFSRATQMTDMIANTVNEICGTVTFPLLTRVQNDKEQFLQLYKNSIYYTAIIMIPITVLLVSLAKYLVIVLLTAKWLPCVFLIQFLALARMFTPFSSIQLNVLNALGRPDLYLKVDLSKTPLILLTLAITIPLGIDAIVIGEFTLTLICFFINSYFPARLIGYGAFSIIYDCRYIILSSILMSLSIYLVTVILVDPFIILLLGGVIGLVVYVLCCFILKVIDSSSIRILLKLNK